MFLFYAQQSPTTMVAPGIPEMILSLLQFPVYGWLAARSSRKGIFGKTLIKIAVVHCFAIIVALLSREFMKFVWYSRA